MTIEEALVLLSGRIGWKDDGTVEGFSLSVTAKATASNRYFQDEHHAVTLENIKDTQPSKNVSGADFNDFLEDLKIRASRKVLTDAFEQDVIDDRLLTQYPRAFDNAISLQMVILVGEQIMTSVRSNRIQRLSKEWVGKLNYDIYRKAPENFAPWKNNTVYSLGIADRYGYELRSVQRRFGQSRNMLKTITKGQVENNYFRELRNRNL